MVQTTIYFIDNTAGDPVARFSIRPRTSDGPSQDSIQQNTDLTLYGTATENWGERFNENFYRLTENFAVPQKEDGDTPIPGTVSSPNEYNSSLDPVWPKSRGDAAEGSGSIGTEFGINAPIPGQTWFNTTSGKLYVYSDEVGSPPLPGWTVVGGTEGFNAGQTWGDFSGSRALDTIYTNTTNNVIAVSIQLNISSSGDLRLEIDGQNISRTDIDTVATNDWVTHFGIVPAGSTYRLNVVSGSVSSFGWYELR